MAPSPRYYGHWDFESPCSRRGLLTATAQRSPEFDHLTLRVDLDETWLADVGFGESFLEPLRIKPGVEQMDRAGTFRTVERGERLLLEKKQPDGTYFAVAPAGRVCRYVRVPSTVSRVAFHAE
jgi:hypothetical protein